MKKLLFAVIVGGIIALNLLPAWNIHLLPKSWLQAFNFRYRHSYYSEFKMWEEIKDYQTTGKEIGLALKDRFSPEDSIILGTIGKVGYYSGMTVHDAHGLVSRDVARSPRPSKLRSPGHDILVLRDFFYPDEPTVTHLKRIESPPRNQENRTLSDRIKYFTDSWRTIGLRWKRYVPEVLPLPPSPDGSTNVLLVWRLIEEKPHIRTLPVLRRKSIRKRRALKEWADFYASLERM